MFSPLEASDIVVTIYFQLIVHHSNATESKNNTFSRNSEANIFFSGSVYDVFFFVHGLNIIPCGSVLPGMEELIKYYLKFINRICHKFWN